MEIGSVIWIGVCGMECGTLCGVELWAVTRRDTW